jgi:hypothetical protein
MGGLCLKWVTREKARANRISCTWLIRHFSDKDAEFLFVPKERPPKDAGNENGIPYDTPDAELAD